MQGSCKEIELGFMNDWMSCFGLHPIGYRRDGQRLGSLGGQPAIYAENRRLKRRQSN